jgi:hypothetical protein
VSTSVNPTSSGGAPAQFQELLLQERHCCGKLVVAWCRTEWLHPSLHGVWPIAVVITRERIKLPGPQPSTCKTTKSVLINRSSLTKHDGELVVKLSLFLTTFTYLRSSECAQTFVRREDVKILSAQAELR